MWCMSLARYYAAAWPASKFASTHVDRADVAGRVAATFASPSTTWRESVDGARELRRAGQARGKAHLSGSMPSWSRKRLAKSMSQSSSSTTISSACGSVLFTTTLDFSCPFGTSSRGTGGTSARLHFSILMRHVGGCTAQRAASRAHTRSRAPAWRTLLPLVYNY